MTGAAAAGLARGPLGAGVTHPGPGAIVVTSSTPLWYLTRATGVVALVLLTIGMVLGLLIAVRFEGRHWPRFITIGLHRNMSLLALTFTAAHVLTTITDNFVPIDLQDAFVPFISPYRPFWLGLGAIAFDLLIALTVTSLVRARLGHRSWRLVHWTVYLCWPVAVLHGLGTGTDTRTRWVLLVTIGCVAAVASLLGWRLAQGWPARLGIRVAGTVALVAALAAGGAWLVTGPLRPGWTGRLGLPAARPGQLGRGTRGGAGHGGQAQPAGSVAVQLPASVTPKVPASAAAHGPASITPQVPASAATHVPGGAAAHVPGSVTPQVPASAATHVPGGAAAHGPGSDMAQAPGSAAAHSPASITPQVPGSAAAHGPASITPEVPGSAAAQVPGGAAAQAPASVTAASRAPA